MASQFFFHRLGRLQDRRQFRGQNNTKKNAQHLYFRLLRAIDKCGGYGKLFKLTMKIALAQLNPTVGDIKGNCALMQSALQRLAGKRPDIVIFPELFLVGYPPRDLLTRSWFIQQAEAALNEVKELSRRFPAAILFGTVTRATSTRGLFNTAILIQNGEELFRQAKTLLPYYDVFDEQRYFDPAPGINIFPFQGQKLGITICEDAWSVLPEVSPASPPTLKLSYPVDPVARQAELGADLFINIAASPFWLGKQHLRLEIARTHSRRHQRPFVFVNLVGGNDELVFDGGSFVLDSKGEIITRLAWFEEELALIDLNATSTAGYQPPAEAEAIYSALVLGLKDYVRKCGFKKVVLGLSGGIDSAVTACIAVAALGRENVLGVTMPSEFSSSGSVTDSRHLAQNLGIELWTIPITPVHHAYLATLKEFFSSTKPDITEENIQARIRGNILMAISNKFGHLVLTTGNKSELAVGYCTLYGDMSGGLAVLADVPKTRVYQLARYINREKEIIPEAILKKPPSAELRPNQRDQDTLPPYEILDQVIELYVDAELGPDEIVARGFDRKLVNWIINKIERNEFKRRQAPPGIKITSRAFGSGRRFPIAARYNL